LQAGGVHKLWLAAVTAGTYVPLVIGIVAGGVGTLVFLLRYQPPPDDAALVEAWPRDRRIALRLVSAVYVGIASLLLVVALVVGDRGFVVAGVLVVGLAAMTLLSLWGSELVQVSTSPGQFRSAPGQPQRRRRLIRSAYLSLALTALGLAVAMGAVVPIACSGCVFLVAVIGAASAHVRERSQSRAEGP
jgi:predicted Co/Zn/Cd cation transporter (cation efflux family)